MPSPRPARRNVILLLLQGRERLLSRFRPVLKAHGVTEQQYRVLRAVELDGPLESRAIGARCHLSTPSLAGVLTRMEAMDLIARKRLAHDQRRVEVSLTTAGRRLFRRMWPEIEAVYETLDADLGDDLTHALFDVLDRVLACIPPSGVDAES